MPRVMAQITLAVFVLAQYVGLMYLLARFDTPAAMLWYVGICGGLRNLLELQASGCYADRVENQ